MLIRIGTCKYHLAIAFLYWYDDIATKQLNLFELVVTPVFHFVISLYPPSLYAGWKGIATLWIRKGALIVCNKDLLRRNK